MKNYFKKVVVICIILTNLTLVCGLFSILLNEKVKATSYKKWSVTYGNPVDGAELKIKTYNIYELKNYPNNINYIMDYNLYFNQDVVPEDKVVRLDSNYADFYKMIQVGNKWQIRKRNTDRNIYLKINASGVLIHADLTESQSKNDAATKFTIVKTTAFEDILNPSSTYYKRYAIKASNGKYLKYINRDDKESELTDHFRAVLKSSTNNDVAIFRLFED